MFKCKIHDFLYFATENSQYRNLISIPYLKQHKVKILSHDNVFTRCTSISTKTHLWSHSVRVYYEDYFSELVDYDVEQSLQNYSPQNWRYPSKSYNSTTSRYYCFNIILLYIFIGSIITIFNYTCTCYNIMRIQRFVEFYSFYIINVFYILYKS